ncbi:MAG: nuclear transport factor 2 family protein [Candidatus Acidiferrum sp.]
MGGVHAVAQNELTQAIAARLRELWDAYLRIDAPAHSAILTEEYRAVHPDGTVHMGKPSAEEIAAAPIEDYWLKDLQAWPAGEEAAIATYTAEVEVRSGLSAKRFKFEVGEVWLKSASQWKCRYYHATMRK